ncbi:hypothetical protein BGX23_009962 [Mortierella sp. AD031]|nr:hypothetical protein BGX23_009962 [Mortierella sp. AD031]
MVIPTGRIRALQSARDKQLELVENLGIELQASLPALGKDAEPTEDSYLVVTFPVCVQQAVRNHGGISFMVDSEISPSPPTPTNQVPPTEGMETTAKNDCIDIQELKNEVEMSTPRVG